IFINELYKGVHVIDNSNPATPTNTAFINIPGNLDVAIKGNKMYADSYVDLLTIDITDLQNPTIDCRDEDVFTLYNYHESRGYYIYNKPTERITRIDCTDPNFGDEFFTRGNVVFLNDANIETGTAIDASGASLETGIAGSLARFSVIKDYLYVINQVDLTAFSLSDPAKPMETQTTRVSWGIETLFPYKDYLFIGSNSGMYIYDLRNPQSPEYISKFEHARACDPVFVKDDVAYVTLRDGTFCQNFINQLDVIDVKNVNNPQLIASFDMQHPHGLSVRDNNLYLCEGDHGLKVFETDELEEVGNNQIEHIKNINAKDAISLGSDHLLVIGDGGLYQFDTSNPSDVEQISFLSVTK
ncbi:MAG: hypothetical protein KJN84_09240, partial [Bacteroidia bacterium]|nr:hypothetical protein [Bacteroidia bacterium]